MKNVCILAFVFLCGCGGAANTSKIVPDSTSRTDHGRPLTASDSNAQFANKIYLKIDEIVSGKVYTDKQNRDVFYRVLVVPDEENTTLIAENIAIGEEGGNYQLLKRVEITNGLTLPVFGSLTENSLKFIDSVTVTGDFDGKKFKIDLSKLTH